MNKHAQAVKALVFKQTFFAMFAGALMLTSMVTVAGDVVMFVGDTAYDRDNELEIQLIDSRGKSHRRILTRYPVLDASIDPTGKTIAYLRADRAEIRTISVDGRGDRLLSRTTEREKFVIDWSPNGHYIAFAHKANFVIYSAVSVFDVRRKRIVATYTLPNTHVAAAFPHFIINIDWSPNSRFLTLMEKAIYFTPPTIRYEHHTSVIDTRAGRYTYFGDHKNYGFLNNRQYIVTTDNGDVGLVDVVKKKVSSLINLGPVQDINRIIAGPRGKRLFAVLKNVRDNFSQGRTGLTRLRGVSREQALGYDFVRVDLDAKRADIVTPQFPAFFEILEAEKQIQWRATTSARTFNTRSCWGWVVTKMGTRRNDRIVGTPFADVIYAGAGNDYVDGAAGNDIICGGAGHDRLYGKSGDDVILGDIALNKNDDSTSGFSGRDLIVAGEGDDFIAGESGNDVLRGGKGNDVVFGGPGNDRLTGQSGEDTGNGGAGNDQCTDFEQIEKCE